MDWPEPGIKLSWFPPFELIISIHPSLLTKPSKLHLPFYLVAQPSAPPQPQNALLRRCHLRYRRLRCCAPHLWSALQRRLTFLQRESASHLLQWCPGTSSMQYPRRLLQRRQCILLPELSEREYYIQSDLLIRWFWQYKGFLNINLGQCSTLLWWLWWSFRWCGDMAWMWWLGNDSQVADTGDCFLIWFEPDDLYGVWRYWRCFLNLTP
jgi:hypothetical protein